MRFLFVTAAVLLSAATAHAKTFQVWDGGCDIPRVCGALGLVPLAEASKFGYVMLDRGGGADDKPSLTFWADLDDKDIAGKTLRITIDGQAVSGLERDIRFTPNKSKDWLIATLSGEEALKLIARFKTGDTLALTTPDGAAAMTLSLKGAVAALLYMDEQQRRIGTVTALARPGSKAANTIPAPPRVPTLVITKPGEKPGPDYAQALWDRLKKDPKSCVGDPDMQAGDTADGRSNPLDETRTLVSIECPGRGAYNTETAFYIVTGGNVAGAQQLRFENVDVDSSEPRTIETLTNAGYDPKTGMISFFGKGRGIADCGATGTYGWDGNAFRPAGLLAMGTCRSVNSDHWPQLWRTKVITRK